MPKSLNFYRTQMSSTMKFFLLLFGVAIFLNSCKKRNDKSTNSEAKEFTVLAWNIWHGANNESLKEDGKPHVIGIIKELDPDIILMVETYGSGKMIADSLGYNFHLIAPEDTYPDDKRINLSVMSRFPMGERFDFYNYFNIGGIVVNWWTTSMFGKAELTDSYREIHPNALENPGITWDQPGKKDEHRIDYIFYKGEKFRPFNRTSKKKMQATRFSLTESLLCIHPIMVSC